MNNELMKKILWYKFLGDKIRKFLVISLFGWMLANLLNLIYFLVIIDDENIGKISLKDTFLIYYSIIIYVIIVVLWEVVFSKKLSRKISDLKSTLYKNINSRLSFHDKFNKVVYKKSYINKIFKKSYIFPRRFKISAVRHVYLTVDYTYNISVYNLSINGSTERKKTGKQKDNIHCSGTFIVIRNEQFNFKEKAVLVEKSLYENGVYSSYYKSIVKPESSIIREGNDITGEFYTYFENKEIEDIVQNNYVLDAIIYLESVFGNKIAISFLSKEMYIYIEGLHLDISKNEEESEKYIDRISAIVDLSDSFK